MTSPETPRRRWYQFRLRTLLIGVTLVVIPFALLGRRLEQARSEKAATSWISSVGGKVEYESDWLHPWISGPVRRVDFFELADMSVSGVDLTILADLQYVEELYVGREVPPVLSTTLSSTSHPLSRGVRDASSIAEMKRLTRLSLADTLVTDLRPLAELEELEWLSLDYSHVTDLTPLTELKNLEVLYLRGTQVSDEQVRMLQKALPDCEIVR
ncbi:MAG: hypothetical protein DWQ31_14930 [Planctomycetota bacterium]|nr:MAG: hypothetical protein DWQ31_14930 [Planctomycetota bacterium]REJ87516.1 MAG: hypothetical protein DWQ35_21245 [Planctomycetota bacterium]REK31106.1 MAG: hypothetical protein DWQ42_01095 [Planctomycetota bacterium]REK44352.1 MAG: hypothetical protein DWQ46_10095 [Planctomycetota bacterium]